MRFDVSAVNFVNPHRMLVDRYDQCLETGTADEVEAGPAAVWIDVEYLLWAFARHAAIVQTWWQFLWVVFPVTLSCSDE